MLLNPDRKSLIAFIHGLDLEEHLIRLSLLGFGPAPDFLIYIYRYVLHWSYRDILRRFLGRPLNEMAAAAQELLADNHALSPGSTAVYLAPLYARLARPCGRALAGRGVGRKAKSKRKPLLAETALEDHFPGGAVEQRRAVARVALRVHALAFGWGDETVLNIFSAARNHDVVAHIFKKVGSDPHAAALVRRKTWLAVRRKRFRYKPELASFMAFTINEAKWCVKAYWRGRRRNKELRLEDGWDESFALEEYLSELFDRLSDPELKDLVAAAKLQLFELLLSLDRRPDHLTIYILRLVGMQPKEIRATYGLTELREVARGAQEKFLEKTDLPPDRVRAALGGLLAKMDRPLGEFAKRKKERVVLADLLSNPAGDIELGEYLNRSSGAEKGDEISQITKSVEQSLITAALGMKDGPLRKLLDMLDEEDEAGHIP